jgi:hypothetical protein
MLSDLGLGGHTRLDKAFYFFNGSSCHVLRGFVVGKHIKSAPSVCRFRQNSKYSPFYIHISILEHLYVVQK